MWWFMKRERMRWNTQQLIENKEIKKQTKVIEELKQWDTLNAKGPQPPPESTRSSARIPPLSTQDVPVLPRCGDRSALAEAKAVAGSGSGNATKGDPWEGLFSPDDEDEFGDDQSDDDSNLGGGGESESQSDDESSGSGDEFDSEDTDGFGGYASDDSDVFSCGSPAPDETREYVHATYVRPQWEPPSVINANVGNYLLASEMHVLRRGAAPALIAMCGMVYEHATGLVLHLQLLAHDLPRQHHPDLRGAGVREYTYVCVHPGWNLRLSADDEAGEASVGWIIRDIQERPERWEVHVRRRWVWKRRRSQRRW
ncbi:hypothetical protein BJ138DRAFT_1183093 [Hygrophoropsis aurantiaca]|uniref:Uncharacterized protein n=1 Tax=Hygrophoropsis aurantiaca TaxID=72124 RepID=A0ACB8A0F2_9AGAM|nr:hypothetical protein BJ138DRAFT_1183093 [Hygrophoropsis aurantiaca]